MATRERRSRTDMSGVSPYPVRLDGLDSRLSRWLWLVKWLLALPHLIVLFFLFIAFLALTIVAFFAILFTGRYPRSCSCVVPRLDRTIRRVVAVSR